MHFLNLFILCKQGCEELDLHSNCNFSLTEMKVVLLYETRSLMSHGDEVVLLLLLTKDLRHRGVHLVAVDGESEKKKNMKAGRRIQRKGSLNCLTTNRPADKILD